MVCVGTVIAIFYFIYTYKFSKMDIIEEDPFNKVWFEIGPIKVGFWPFSHFVLYTILGFLFPQCWLIIMILGIIWEGIEVLAGCLFEKEKQKGFSTSLYQGKWWQANLYDPLFNAMGFIVGAGLAATLRKTVKV